jgi:uncharacterized protein YfbU (UPF0304 family)
VEGILSSQYNFLAQIEPVQDKIYFKDKKIVISGYETKPNQTSKQSSSSHYGLPEINEV